MVQEYTVHTHGWVVYGRTLYYAICIRYIHRLCAICNSVCIGYTHAPYALYATARCTGEAYSLQQMEAAERIRLDDAVRARAEVHAVRDILLYCIEFSAH